MPLIKDLIQLKGMDMSHRMLWDDYIFNGYKVLEALVGTDSMLFRRGSASPEFHIVVKK